MPVMPSQLHDAISHRLARGKASTERATCIDRPRVGARYRLIGILRQCAVDPSDAIEFLDGLSTVAASVVVENVSSN